MKLKYYLFTIILPISLFLGSCNDSDDGNDSVGPTTDQSEVLKNYADNFIIPSYTAFRDAVTTLETTLDSYSSDDHTTLISQVDAAYLAWQSCSYLEFGPASLQLLQNNINIYPVDTTQINANVENDFTDIRPSTSDTEKGLGTLDYLVNTRTNLSEKEIAYLKLVVLDMSDRIVAVVDAWTGTTDYRGSFIANVGTDNGSSTSSLLNAFILYFERYLRDGKLGIPLGIRSFNKEQRPEDAEAFYATTSHLLLQENMSSMKDFFYGGTGAGFDDLILNDDSSSDLLTELTELWNESETAVNGINTPIEDYVFSNQEDGEAIYAGIQELLVLLKIEVTSSLDVKVNFVDTDGD